MSATAKAAAPQFSLVPTSYVSPLTFVASKTLWVCPWNESEYGAGIAKEVEGGNGWMDQLLQQFNACVASIG